MLANRITLNVLADISRKVNKGGYPAPRDQVLIVFNGSNIDLAPKLDQLKKLRERDWTISLAFSFMAGEILDQEGISRELAPRNVYGEEDIFQLEKIVGNHSRLIMPNITMNTLSKTGLGMIDSFSSTILWTYLYQGKEVYLDFDSVRNYLGGETKNQAIKGLISKHIEVIKSMGAKEIKGNKYMENIFGQKEFVSEKENKDLLGDKKKNSSKEVYTERDILKLDANTTLSLSKGSVITPLARDRARELGIKIQR